MNEGDSVADRLATSIWSTLLPSSCSICGVRGSHPLCTSCYRQLPLITGPCCNRCGAPSATPLERCAHCSSLAHVKIEGRALMVYAAKGEELILQFKRHGQPAVAQRLAQITGQLIPDHFLGDAVVPVPCSRTRWWKHGFAPSVLVSRKIAIRYQRPMLEILVPTALRRQTHQSRAQRLDRGAFKLQRTGTKLPKRLTLVDDVVTTGATVKKCRYALTRAGIKEVNFIAIARTCRG